MSNSVTKNALRNIAFGSLNRVTALLLPFVTRTVTLQLLGASYLGIGTLFSSILSFLSLTELGLGSAIVYSMYKPIAENDTHTIGALLSFYKKLYRIIGIIVLVLGTLILPLVPFLIKGDAPTGINVYVLYYIYLVNSVISYFFAGYRQSLLTAHQRSDITSNISSVVNICVQAGQILALCLTHNFYVYAFVPIVGTLSTNFVNWIITTKKYSHIKCNGDISDDTKNEIKRKITGLFGTKLNSIVVHSADTIVISAFLGLTLTAQYGNYYYIMNAVCGFVAVFYTSITAGVGSKLVTDGVESNLRLFKNLSFINAWMVSWCCVCFLCLYEPFMKLWVGEEMSLGIEFVVLMVAYFFIYEIQRTVLTFKDAAGLWNKDKMRPYVSMTVNVVSNLLLVQFFGIYGIVLSTILAFMISLPWANHVLFKNLFQRNSIQNIFSIFKYFVITVASCIATYFVCGFCGDTMAWFIVRVVMCVIIPNLIMLLCFYRTQEFEYLKAKIGSFIKRA